MERKSTLGIAILLATSTGCAYSANVLSGAIYSNVRWGVTANGLAVGSVEGEACATSILGIVAFGDAGIEAARRNGRIIYVRSVDHSASNFLFLFAEYCTIVHGDAMASSSEAASPTSGAAGVAARGGAPVLPPRATVAARMEGAKPAIVACVPDQTGTATVHLTIEGASGNVFNAWLSGPFERGPQAECILSAVRSLRFPRFPRPTMDVTYSYVIP